MDIDVSSFRPISMRGRVAFAIMCLEESIMRLAPEPERWLVVVNQLWKYTSEESLDVWQEVTAEFTPGAILKYAEYVEQDYELLTRDGFWLLRDLYQSCDPLLRELTDLVFDIGTLELFGSLDGFAPQSLRHLVQVLRLLGERGLPVPSVDLVSEQAFTSRHGWGNPFDAGHLRRLLARQPCRQ